MEKIISVAEACKKIEYYCKYQERCHNEVLTKLISFCLNRAEIDKVFIFVLENDLLNEERFAQTFARGKHRIKSWGKVRITNELKVRNISNRIIATALKQISEEEYLETFHALADRNWDTITEKNKYKKRTKFCDFMLRKGFESPMVYEKVKQLEED
jgi:regulatory protein